jgi:Uma2 family endonuclease
MGMVVKVPQYTVDDLDALPDDGNRYELLAGTLIVTPSPGSAHQGVAANLSALFARALLAKRLRLFSPGVIRSSPLTQLEPDILVVPPRFVAGTAWEDITEHWLAIEVLSRSSRVYDREFKRDAYIALGVREVWLVDIRNHNVEVCTAPGDGSIVHTLLEWTAPDQSVSVTIELDELFSDLM